MVRQSGTRSASFIRYGGPSRRIPYELEQIPPEWTNCAVIEIESAARPRFRFRILLAGFETGVQIIEIEDLQHLTVLEALSITPGSQGHVDISDCKRR
jgi:hypothetical protein